MNRTGLLGVLVFVMLFDGAAHAAEGGSVTIVAGQLLDVAEGRLLPDVVIRVEEGVIRSVEPGGRVVSGDEVIDLTNYVVLPGLIDAHTHLCDNTHLGEEWDPWTYPAPMFGVIGVANALRTLDAGFTTVRDVSAPFFADVALRDAIEQGLVPGPRMFVSGPMITMTGGHGAWGNWIGPPHEVSTDAHSVADGPVEMRTMARRHIRHGVDLLKIAATGGFGTHGSIPGASSFTVDEMKAAVEEAHKRGLTVAAHAHGDEGIRNAVEAGVDSIEHGTLIEAETIRLLIEYDVALVVDLLAAHYDLIERKANYEDKQLEDDNGTEYAKYADRCRQAHETGVKIVFGSDAGVFPHGRNAEQFRLMVDAGMTAIDAIRSATSRAAKLLGIEQHAGTVEPGKWADLIAVSRDPLEDVSALEDVRFVMKEGRVHRTAH